MLASYSQCLLFTTWNLSISLIFSKSQLLDWYINSHQCSEGPGNIGKNMWEFKETQILQSINVRDLFQEVQQHFKDNNFIEIPTEHKILLHTTQFSGFKSIRGIVQPPPLSNFRTFSLFQKEAWHPSAAIPCSHTASRARTRTRQRGPRLSWLSTSPSCLSGSVLQKGPRHNVFKPHPCHDKT